MKNKHFVYDIKKYKETLTEVYIPEGLNSQETLKRIKNTLKGGMFSISFKSAYTVKKKGHYRNGSLMFPVIIRLPNSKLQALMSILSNQGIIYKVTGYWSFEPSKYFKYDFED